jgi:CcmD family protein
MSLLYHVASHQGTLVVILVIWFGLFLYLVRLDRRIAELEESTSASSRVPPGSAGPRGE